MEKIKKNVGNIILLIVSVFIAILVSEISLRIILPKIENEKFSIGEGDKVLIPDNIISHRLRPTPQFGIDENGFKNKEVLTTYDIVALGDSHTYGEFDGVSWTDYLKEKTDKNIYNIGVWGYGTAQYRYLIDKALEFKPKVIVIGFYMGNDVYDTYDIVYRFDKWNSYRKEDVDSKPVVTTAEHGRQDVLFSSLRLFIRDKIVLYKFLSDRTRIIREKLGLAKPYYIGTTDWTNTDSGSSLIYDDIDEIKTFFRNGERIRGVDLNDQNTKEGLRLTELFLSEINKKVVDSGSKLLVVFIPTKQSVYKEKVGEKGQNNAIFQAIVENENIIKKEIENSAKENGFKTLDILDYMQESLEKNIRLYPDSIDDHPNSVGYIKYAEAMLPSIFDLFKK